MSTGLVETEEMELWVERPSTENMEEAEDEADEEIDDA